MGFIHIKKQNVTGPEGEPRTVYAVQAIAINAPQGKRLIPNPSGNEACVFDTFEEAEAAVQRAGFDYIFEGRKVYLTDRMAAPHRPVPTYGDYGAAALQGAVPLLIERLRDREPSILANAAFALGEIRDPACIQPLIDILGHEDANVRKAVAEALAKLGGGALGALQAAYENARTTREKYGAHARLTVMTAYLEMTHTHRELLNQVLPQAIGALTDENWLVRAQAALVVGQAAQFFRDEREQPGAVL